MKDYTALGGDGSSQVTTTGPARVGDTWTTIEASGAIPSAPESEPAPPTKRAVRNLYIAAGYFVAEMALDGTVGWIIYSNNHPWLTALWLFYCGMSANSSVKRFSSTEDQ